MHGFGIAKSPICSLKAIIILAILMLFTVCRASFADELTLSGSDAPVDGQGYTASGGCAPYNWTISKGAIADNGVVSVSGQCGKATVTVTDACGATATKEVRMPSGTWVIISSGCSPDSDSHGAYCDIYNCYCGRDFDSSATISKVRCRQPAWICPHCCKWLLTETVREWRCRNEANCVDRDGDGVFAMASDCATGSDCNDSDAHIHPGSLEFCDAKDNNCDGQIDEDGLCDADADGVPDMADQCPGTREGVAVDGAGCPLPICTDHDGDGFAREGGVCGPVDICDTCPLIGDRLPPTTPFEFNPGDGGTTTYPDGTQEDGKDADDKLGEPGTFADPAKGTGKAVPSSEPCNTKREISSSVKLTSGALRDELPLFATNGTGLPTSLAFYYDSLSPYCGPLGIGWSHSYDLVIKENDFAEMVFKDGRGRYWLYEPSGSGYLSRPGDTATLEKTADGRFVRILKDGTRFAFGTNRRLASITDRNGNSMAFGYVGDNLVEIVDGNQRVTILEYDSQGQLTAITDPSGQRYAVTVENGMLTNVLFPDGGNWRYSYVDHGFLSAKTDPDGHLVTYAYDDQHRLVGNVDADSGMHQIAYLGGAGTMRATAFTDKDGAAWLYTYDTRNGDLAAKNDPAGNVTSYTYDVSHNLTAMTEPGIGTTIYSYDNQGNLTAITDPAGNVTSYTYNGYGEVTGVTDVGGSMITYDRDERGNLIKVTFPDGGRTIYQHDEQGRLVSITTATGEITVVDYDAQGNVARITGPNGQATAFAYDASGRRIATTDAGGNVTRFEYDARGRLVSTIDPLGNVTRHEYDAKANRTRIVDANGRATTFTYNSEGQVLGMTNALGHTATFAYGGSTGCVSCGGGVGALTALTDAKGQTTRFQYDQLGRLIKETDPLNRETVYDYDAAGRITAKTDSKGQTIRYSYDTLGRLTSKAYPDGTQATFTYDAKGNLTAAANASIAYTLAYDSSDRVVRVTDSFGYSIGYDYDAAGRRTKLTGSGDITIAYAYDAAGRLAKIDSPAGPLLFGYDTLGRRSQLSYPNGVATNYTYDALDRFTDLVSAAGVSTLAENHYTHDAVGNRLSTRDARATTSYGYDAIYRLTEASSNVPGYSGNINNTGSGIVTATQNQKEFYVYDPVGNRLQTDQVKSYEHDAGNQLLGAGSTTYTYDANGNLTQKIATSGTTAYAWDAENQLTQVTLPDGRTVTFAYDPFGRRVAKTADSIVIRYVYAGEDILLTTENGALGNVYIHGPGIDEPLALLDSKGAAYYHADGLGSIVALTDGQANVVQRYEYDSFGNRHDLQNRIKQPYSYTGREHDRETGLYYYRARYYDAEVGRFISKDPIGFAGGDVNLYNYVGGNPVNRLDPLGKIDPVVAVGLVWALAYFTHVGDLISEPNGNLWGEPQDQDYTCTLPWPVGPIADQCVLDRCIQHDECYEQNACTASSWVSGALGGTKSCNQCNYGFFE